MNLPTKLDYLDFFQKKPVPNPVALTLTLKQRVESNHPKGRFGENIDSVKVSENTRHFMNRLNQSVFGKGFTRYGKRLSVVPVIEGNSFIRFHIHITLEKPVHLDLDEFRTMIIKSWTKTKFGYHDIDIKGIDNYHGWLDYKLKNRSKGEGLQSSVDWDNVFLH
jgi:hypothetical protein